MLVSSHLQVLHSTPFSSVSIIILCIFDKKYQICSSSSCVFNQPITSSVFGKNIIPSTLFPNTDNVHYSFIIRTNFTPIQTKCEYTAFTYFHSYVLTHSVVVKALCYKPECRGFETSWDEWTFSVYLSGCTRPSSLLNL
jgi:hypothetical protein